jgi:cyclic di-GMP phosphodiesterase
MRLHADPKEQNASPFRPVSLLRDDCTRTGSQSDARTILLLDGAVGRRRSTTRAVGQLGHHLVEVRNAAEALSLAGSQSVDLVIADLLVPGMGGSAFCRAIRAAANSPLLPVILIAQRGYLDEEVKAIEAGVDAVLPYAVHPRALRAAVQSCLRRKAAMDELDETETVLFTLAQSVEQRDPALGRHCERLALMAATLGVAMGLGREDILALQRGGFLHDIGKVAIPDNVLFKPGPLNVEEWEAMKSHAERGERICRNMRSLAPVLPIIRSHHERWDGTGYPDGLKGEEIPLLARIMQLADIYDALTTTRPYKRALTPAEAVRIMREETEKGWRDPKLMQVFIDLLPFFSSPESAELSQISLQALAAAIDRYRRDPERASAEVADAAEDVPVATISGL